MDAHPAIRRVARALAGRTPREAERDEPFREAAVALVLRPGAGESCDILLIRRAVREGDPWSGQVALPGGGHHPEDASLEATALRETLEEVGLDIRAHGRMLGVLDDLRPRTPVLPPVIVRPYVAVVRDPPALVLSDEVAGTEWVSVEALLDPVNRVQTSVETRGMRFSVTAMRVGDLTVWGMTERIITGFEEVWR